MDNTFIQKIKECNSVAELKEVAIKNGYTLTDTDAKFYFDMFHSDGNRRISSDELDNVSGGKCKNGRLYSDDDPYYLITTWVNSCDLLELKEGHDPFTSPTCMNCKHVFSKGATAYCKKRTYYNDPLNPSK